MMLSYMYLCFPGYIKKPLHPVFSNRVFCPNARVQEEATFLLFLDFLEECELKVGNVGVNLLCACSL